MTRRLVEPRCWRQGCAHGKDAHLHFRVGTDCGLCDCPQFMARGRRWWRRWFR